MSTDVEEAVLVETGPSWYSKMFECVKNRNRIGPGKVELPDCDFFNVGPRRTLRVLLPKPRASVYYEPTANERPETIDENFVSRWAMRPHPSGNCRCSFRRSYRLSTNEERIINAELNRIRTSLCEAEKTGEDMDELEQRISVNLDVLRPTDDRPSEKIDEPADRDNFVTAVGNVGNDDLAMKNKIVKDLERYIEVLLQEVLNDTMKLFGETEDSSMRNKGRGNEKDFSEIREKSISNRGTEHFEDGTNSLNIKFAFHDDELSKPLDKMAVEDREENGGGYVNRAFSGSKTDPDSLDFDLRKPLNAEIVIDNLDCIDSGINSVETIEFPTSQEPSLEESLMKIIDAKLGRAPLKQSWEDLRDKTETTNEIKADEEISKNSETIESPKNTPIITETEVMVSNEKMEESSTNVDEREPESEIPQIVENNKNNSIEENPGKSSNDLEDIEDHLNFDKLRLELVGNDNETKKGAIATFREKFSWKFGKNREDEKQSENVKIEVVPSSPVELRVKRKPVWTNSETSEINQNDETVEFVKFRKNKKPAIVFLHGFGSSAEIFDHQLEYFSNLGYPCIAPEMLGHGMSSAPDRSRDYHFDKLLKDLEMVLQHYAFRPGRKCVLVAHNYGCSFATALAYKYDTKIHQLVLISGGGPTPLAPPSSEGAAHCCLRAMLTPLLMCGLHRDILYSARGRQHPYCGSEPPEQWPSHMKYVLDGMVWPEGDYVFHRRISTPTLLIHGLRDNKVSLVQECQMERTIIKAFLDAIPTAGHTPMTDCPEQVNHMIHCFIDLWRRKKR